LTKSGFSDQPNLVVSRTTAGFGNSKAGGKSGHPTPKGCEVGGGVVNRRG